MSQYYELSAFGTSPLTLAVAKAWMKVTSSADDALIQILIDSATEYGEKYTGRDFRANTWITYLDDFEDRIVLNRHPVASITSVEYLVGDVLTAIATTVYYLKKQNQCALILLQEDQEWPSDLDNIEHGIKIIFVTEAYTRAANQFLDAMMRLVAALYAARGDCSMEDAAQSSGANAILDQFRISRV